MPYLCWVFNDDLQQTIIGVSNCAIGMLNKLPTYKHEILSIAHNSDCDCIFLF